MQIEAWFWKRTFWEWFWERTPCFIIYEPYSPQNRYFVLLRSMVDSLDLSINNDVF